MTTTLDLNFVIDFYTFKSYLPISIEIKSRWGELELLAISSKLLEQPTVEHAHYHRITRLFRPYKSVLMSCNVLSVSISNANAPFSMCILVLEQ